MKKRGFLISSIVGLSATFLFGCGTPMYELTSEEEEKIVQGAALSVSKLNIRQKDGMNWVKLEDASESLKPEPETTSEKPSESQTTNNNTEIVPDNSNTISNAVSLSEALDCSGQLEFTFKELRVENDYLKDGMLIQPDTGKKLIILSFTMKNISSGDLQLNMSSTGSSFTLYVDSKNSVTMNRNYVSLDTYIGTLKQGASDTVILVFEASDTVIKKLSNPYLKVTRKGTSYSVKL